MAALHFTQDNFETEVLKSSQPVLVDFWATWCGPCRMITPFVEQLADEFAGQAKVGKVDVDENPDLAAKYGVNGVPTLLVIKDGKVVDKTVGAAPKARLADMLKRVL